MKTTRLSIAQHVLLLLICAAPHCESAHPIRDGVELDNAIRSEMETRRIPSVTACIMKKTEIVWMGSYGLADKENNIPATEQTVYLLASLSKTVVATAVMQLVENGRIDIDEDINSYLPFSVRNPHHSQSVVTARMLLTHTSGLTGPKTDNELPGFYDWFPPDTAPSLDQTLADYILPSGSSYVPAVWTKNDPGRVELYSNLGVTLLAYLVEYVSKEKFSSYCRDHIFLPLGMTETSYQIEDLNSDNLAVWYLESSQPVAYYTRRDYPAGQVKSSLNDWAHFLAVWMNDGEFQGTRILNKTSVDEALLLHNPASGQCLIWNKTIGDWYGHSGGVIGTSTYMEFHRADQVGLIILSNMYHQTENPAYPPTGKIYELIRNFANQFRDPD